MRRLWLTAIPLALAAEAAAAPAFYEGFENQTGIADYLAASGRWIVSSETAAPPEPLGGPSPTGPGAGTWGWSPTFGENVSILRHRSARENVPGAAIVDAGAVLPIGDFGGDYWNSAYPIGVGGEFYLGTGDVRPAAGHPWNFNPKGDGTGVADQPLDGLTLEMVSEHIPFETDDPGEATRFVSFLIGGSPGSADLVSVSVEIQPSCAKGEPVTVEGVDVYWGDRGDWPSLKTRIYNRDPDLRMEDGARAFIQPYARRGLGDERMSLVVIDLWGRDFKNGGNPHAGSCGGRIRVRDLDPAGHLNVDEIRVGSLDDLPYEATPFGARAYLRDGDAPPAVYGFADLHTHWMSHLGSGAEPIPSVTGPATRKTLRALTTAMSALSGRPFQPRKVPKRDICPTGSDCPALTEEPRAATGCTATDCTLGPRERDRLALAMCDGDGGGSGKHQDRGGDLFADANYRSDSASSNLLTSLDVHAGSGPCGIYGNDCSHERFGFDYETQQFRLPARPFMSRIHQQMYWKWVKRAWQGGLRVLVTDVVHNLPLDLLLNNLWAIENPANPVDVPIEVVVGHGADEQYALQRQVCGVRKLLSRTPAEAGGQGASEVADWAEVVTTPADARRVIAAGKLAVVLGAELDTTGALRAAAGRLGAENEVEFMRRLGIRKITPVHQMDNTLGGAAVFSAFLSLENDAFNLANDMMDGANCATAQNFLRRIDPNADTTFGQLNRWLYGIFPYVDNSLERKDSGAYEYWRPDVYGHLASGQISCTLDYNTFLQADGATWCPGSTRENFYPDSIWSGCWSPTHFYDVELAPHDEPDPRDEVHFSIAKDGEALKGSNGEMKRVAMDHVAAYVTNNDGYIPTFLNAPAPTEWPQRYWENPLLRYADGVRNQRGLSADGERYLEAMRERALLIDVEHMAERTREAVFAESIDAAGCSRPPYSDECLVGAYPVIATHSDLRWSFDPGSEPSTVSERTLKSTEVQHILRTGGVVGLSTGYEFHRDAAAPAEAGRGFGAFNDCPGSSKSFAQKMLAYVANGEQAGVLTNYFTEYLGTHSAHPAPRPPHWSAVGVGLGSDMNGFAIQIGPRFNANLGTSCYGKSDLSFDPNDGDPGAPARAQAQLLAANGVDYGGLPSGTNIRSRAPGHGIPAQPPLEKLRFDPALGDDVYVEEPVDVFTPARPQQSFHLRGFDFNLIGMANIGLEPDMLQDVVNGMRSVDVSTFTDMRYQMRYLMRGAEDFIETWERAVDWCRRSGSTTCDEPAAGAGYPADACDVWASDVDDAPTITDATPSCMARCGQTLHWQVSGETRSCRCWIHDGDDHPTDLCDDFKPWCQWFYNGEDDPDGRVSRGSP